MQTGVWLVGTPSVSSLLPATPASGAVIVAARAASASDANRGKAVDSEPQADTWAGPYLDAPTRSMWNS